MTTNTADISLLETLQNRDYEPQDTASSEGEWFDFIASGIGSIRVVINPDDGPSFELYRIDKFMCELWGIRFTPGTPQAVIIAALDAAEADLAAERGGPLR